VSPPRTEGTRHHGGGGLTGADASASADCRRLPLVTGLTIPGPRRRVYPRDRATGARRAANDGTQGRSNRGNLGGPVAQASYVNVLRPAYRLLKLCSVLSRRSHWSWSTATSSHRFLVPFVPGIERMVPRDVVQGFTGGACLHRPKGRYR